MNVYLVRHAKAGSRRKWQGPDEERPLTGAGRRQALALAARLRAGGVTKVLSSPYVRCVETVEPLAQQCGVEVERLDALAEGAPLVGALRLVEKVSDEPAALCTHGDVMGLLLDHARRTGAPVEGDGLEKGCIWALDVESGSIVSARHEPAPS